MNYILRFIIDFVSVNLFPKILLCQSIWKPKWRNINKKTKISFLCINHRPFFMFVEINFFLYGLLIPEGPGSWSSVTIDCLIWERLVISKLYFSWLSVVGSLVKFSFWKFTMLWEFFWRCEFHHLWSCLQNIEVSAFLFYKS